MPSASWRTTSSTLAWVFKPDEAVHDVHARLFEHAGTVDVGLLVEAGLELDERDDLLALLGRLDERADDRALGAGGAVDGLLDREHVRVAGGLLDELLDRRRERVVRVVHEHVAVLRSSRKKSGAGSVPCSTTGVCGTHGSSLSSGRSSA